VGQAAGGATAISSGLNLHQTPHRPLQAGHSSWTGWRRRWPHTCAGIGRRPAPTHTRPHAAQARRDRRSRCRKRRRGPTHARHRNVVDRRRRRQRSRMRSTREGACPIRAGGRGGQLDRPVDKLHIRPTKLPTAKNGALFRFFSRLRFCGAPKNGASILPNAV
jgi:hypothetical protein